MEIIVYTKVKNIMPLLEEISYGIEEEGVPFRLILPETKEEIAKLEKQISESTDSVFVEIKETKITIFIARNFKKHIIDERMIDKEYVQKEQLRLMGKNAGRYIKGQSLAIDDKR